MVRFRVDVGDSGELDWPSRASLFEVIHHDETAALEWFNPQLGQVWNCDSCDERTWQRQKIKLILISDTS